MNHLTNELDNARRILSATWSLDERLKREIGDVSSALAKATYEINRLQKENNKLRQSKKNWSDLASKYEVKNLKHRQDIVLIKYILKQHLPAREVLDLIEQYLEGSSK